MTDFDVDEFLGGYRPPRLTAKITMRADLQRELAALHDEYQDELKSEALNSERLPRIVGEIERLVEELNASRREFVFEALGSWSYKKLAEKHPPLPSEKTEGAQVHMDTFATALVAASAVSPNLTVQDAEALRDRLTDNQWTKLVTTALAVNLGDDTPPKFEPRSLPEDAPLRSSDSPLSGESLAASFSDE